MQSPPTGFPGPTPTAEPTRSALTRPEAGRVFGGVAVGVAEHLAVPVKWVRLTLVILGMTGAGLVAYIFLWIMVPSGDQPTGRVSTTRLAPRLKEVVGSGRTGLLLGGGLALLALAGILYGSLRGYGVPINWLWPALVFLGALALAWSQLEKVDSLRSARPVSWLRLVGALVLVVVAMVLLINQGRQPAALLAAIGAGIGVLAGVALVLAPWWLRLIRALGQERSARAREGERADIAAHLHDSVLQTLALIRARADQPELVRKLARAQERELRSWLYQDRQQSSSSLAALLTAVAAEVEDTVDQEIGVVLVADCLPTSALEALVGATREALMNAVRHGGPPVSLYGELGSDPIKVFVLDRGTGFDMDSISPDRLGLRESIIGRVERQGGTVQIITGHGRGTEVRLSMNREKEATGG